MSASHKCCIYEVMFKCYCTYLIVYTSYTNLITAHCVDVKGVGFTHFQIIVIIDLFVYIFYYVLSARKLYLMDV